MVERVIKKQLKKFKKKQIPEQVFIVLKDLKDEGKEYISISMIIEALNSRQIDIEEAKIQKVLDAMELNNYLQGTLSSKVAVDKDEM